MNKKRIIFACILAVVVSLTFMLINKYANASKTKTEIVLNGQAEDYIEVPCFAARDEVLIETPNEMLLDFTLNEGEKLESGRVIAKIYKTEKDRNILKSIQKLENDVNNLEALKDIHGKISGKREYISKAVGNLVSKIKLSFLNNEYYNFNKNHDEVLDILSKQKALINGDEDFSDKIDKLKNEKNLLEKNLQNIEVKKIVASTSGYISFMPDGFENTLPLNRLAYIKPKDITELLQMPPVKIKHKAKIVKSPYWYILCNVPSERLNKVSIGSVLEISSFGVTKSIPAEVIYINKSEETSALVLKCNYLNKDTLNFRKGNIKIILNKFEGLKFSKKALHEKTIQKTEKNSYDSAVAAKPVWGVYKLNSKNKPVFKEVEILFLTDEFVICKNKENTEEPLEQYDEVIVSAV